MNRFLTATLIVLGISTASVASAQDTTGVFVARALGVKVGEFTLNGTEKQGRYAVSSTFVTTGLAGAVSGAHFDLKSRGKVKSGRFAPSEYTEEMNTGRRQSNANLTYRGGVARAKGERVGDRGEYAVTDAQQKGAVDPLTALYMVLRNQPRDGLCQINQNMFDGERLTRVVMTGSSVNGEHVTCVGQFQRIGGYAPDDKRYGTSFNLTVTYAPSGDVMQAVKMTADTTYGAATLVRK